MEIRNISKSFETTQALDDVSFDLYPGEIHALLGENGAGKSTLIKIMTGVHPPDQGEILLDGQPIRINNTVEAQGYGIAAIYQEPMIYPDLTVAENIFISHRDQGAILRWGKMYREAEAILRKIVEALSEGRADVGAIVLRLLKYRNDFALACRWSVGRAYVLVYEGRSFKSP